MGELLSPDFDWQGKAGDFLDAEAEHEAVFVLVLVVSDEEAERPDKGVEVMVEAVLLEFEVLINDLITVVGADPPVVIEAGKGLEDDAVGIPQDGVVVEVAVFDVEFEVRGRHEAKRGGDFGEVIISGQRELGFEIQFKPWHGIPAQVVVDVRKVAVKFRVFDEGVEVGVEHQPVVGSSVAAGDQAIAHAHAEDAPFLEVIDGGEAPDLTGAGPAGRGEALDAPEG